VYFIAGLVHGAIGLDVDANFFVRVRDRDLDVADLERRLAEIELAVLGRRRCDARLMDKSICSFRLLVLMPWESK
jgi:hypothetical protein